MGTRKQPSTSLAELKREARRTGNETVLGVIKDIEDTKKRAWRKTAVTCAPVAAGLIYLMIRECLKCEGSKERIRTDAELCVMLCNYKAKLSKHLEKLFPEVFSSSTSTEDQKGA